MVKHASPRFNGFKKASNCGLARGSFFKKGETRTKRGSSLTSSPRRCGSPEYERKIAELERKVGQLTMEVVLMLPTDEPMALQTRLIKILILLEERPQNVLGRDYSNQAPILNHRQGADL